MELTKVIKSPILTEKSDRLRSNEKNQVFTFKVDFAANKYQIKEAVETIFNVKVSSVNTIKVNKKPKNVGRFHGFTNRYKKAMVTLAEGSLNYLPSNETEAQIVSDEKAVEKKEQKAKKVSDVEAKVAKKLATKKTVATKQTAVKKQATTKRKVGGE
ncbi:50S ribosomal protein L23 [Mycoplasmopsis canis PG 14]|uniref:Large ribosomal subunit protein uL23 n=1 Tax=Mycoplasmopsis canis TaxID=29555 RepID=A0A449ARI1_9BACT|nr:50S ribosomal protein L23 [Mycoplasmopsis canis]AMD81460.1 50S ribosomal protein L23 [Mycoplasmopsis canis PG 14]EIE39519.1 50S ribosomal protein L23 [Mycoplasmopsis canis PG 14]VEU69090.1 50S ribosomal protein L23 [Mycoplasmopsis canis]